MRGAIGVAFEGDGRHVDDGRLGEAALQLVVVRLAVGQAQPPAVVVDHDRDVIGVVEAAALRSKVASSKSHCGEAVRQMSLANSRR